jgi:hypothetical protein
MTEELTTTLVISVTSSYCGNCRQPTLPRRTHHTDISGYDPRPGGGCGARFVDMETDNRAVTDWHLKQVRPDLPIRGEEEAEEPGRECPTCGAPADEAGVSIPEHRPGSPCTVDYRAI